MSESHSNLHTWALVGKLGTGIVGLIVCSATAALAAAFFDYHTNR